MIRLILPLPPSPNDTPSHHMEEHRAKRRYQGRAWLAAVKSQHRPLRDPPARVLVTAHLALENLRDDDNRNGSLKWALDALRQKQRGKLNWRQGLFDKCGYFIDDDPGHLTVGEVTQAIDRDDPRLELSITEVLV